MDVNLAYPVALNVTLGLIDSSKSIWNNLSLLLAALIGAIAAGSIQFIIAIWNNKKSERSRQMQAHCSLLGCKQVLLQYFYSYFLSSIAARGTQHYAKIMAISAIDFVPAKAHLKCGNEVRAKLYLDKKIASQYDRSYDLKEALRSRERSENLQLQLGDAKERFWKNLGLIKTLFEDAKIENLIRDIEIAEKRLGEFDKEIPKLFNLIDIEMKEGIGSICIDSNLRQKYTDSPNKNRDIFVKSITEKLECEMDTLTKSALSNIEFLESKIDNLLSYIDEILSNKEFCSNCKLFCSSKKCPLDPKSKKDENNKISPEK